MTYLDTGCFVKLYYPEPDSAKVVALVQSKALCHTPLHELEFMNALQLKVFLRARTSASTVRLVNHTNPSEALVILEPCFRDQFSFIPRRINVGTSRSSP